VNILSNYKLVRQLGKKSMY